MTFASCSNHFRHYSVEKIVDLHSKFFLSSRWVSENILVSVRLLLLRRYIEHYHYFYFSFHLYLARKCFPLLLLSSVKLLLALLSETRYSKKILASLTGHQVHRFSWCHEEWTRPEPIVRMAVTSYSPVWYIITTESKKKLFIRYSFVSPKIYA